MVTATVSKPRCPKCNSTMVRFLHKTQEQVCDKCGHRWPKTEAPRE